MLLKKYEQDYFESRVWNRKTSCISYYIYAYKNCKLLQKKIVIAFLAIYGFFSLTLDSPNVADESISRKGSLETELSGNESNGAPNEGNKRGFGHLLNLHRNTSNAGTAINSYFSQSFVDGNKI